MLCPYRASGCDVRQSRPNNLGVLSYICYAHAGPFLPAGRPPCPQPAPPPKLRPRAATAPAPAGPSRPKARPRASRNALKHGLDALHHLVLEDEDPGELEGLTARLVEEVGAQTELEARLARRLAVAFWKGERAERMEVALVDAAPKLRPPTVGGAWEQADPLATFDVRRFNAVRGHQAAQGREIGRCLKELRQLRRDALAADTGEPEAASRNEPEDPPAPANDAAPVPRACIPPAKRGRGTNPTTTPGTTCPQARAPSSTGCWPPTTGPACRGWAPPGRCCRGAQAPRTSPRPGRSAAPCTAGATPPPETAPPGAGPPRQRPWPRSGPNRWRACSSTNTCA